MFSMVAWTAANCSVVVRRNLFAERQPACQPVAFLQNWPLLRPIITRLFLPVVQTHFVQHSKPTCRLSSVQDALSGYKISFTDNWIGHLQNHVNSTSEWPQLCSNEEFIFSKKLKQSRYTPRRALGGRRYSSCSFFTLALDGVSGQRYTPAAL
jgi:hypothetical protein